MGLMESPYHAYQAVFFKREVSLGDRKIKDNPLCWYEVVSKLPEDLGYLPHLT